MTVRVDVHLAPADLHAGLRADARRGLTATPKDLPPKWFYDDRGSQLFDEITRLDEYYPTRAERSDPRRARADEIATASGADTLVELGSGTSEKTRLLLDALARAGQLRRFVPFDVSETTLRDAAARDRRRAPRHRRARGRRRLRAPPRPSSPAAAAAWSRSSAARSATCRRRRGPSSSPTIAAGLEPGDSFLLGTDLVKDADRLVAAYDDAAGVTAEFNRNVLHVHQPRARRRLRPRAFDHVARWNADDGVDRDVAPRPDATQTVKVPELDLIVEFAAGEEMRTEISAKFRRRGHRSRARRRRACELTDWWTDPRAGDFALASAPHRGAAASW